MGSTLGTALTQYQSILGVLLRAIYLYIHIIIIQLLLSFLGAMTCSAAGMPLTGKIPLLQAASMVNFIFKWRELVVSLKHREILAEHRLVHPAVLQLCNSKLSSNNNSTNNSKIVITVILVILVVVVILALMAKTCNNRNSSNHSRNGKFVRASFAEAVRKVWDVVRLDDHLLPATRSKTKKAKPQTLKCGFGVGLYHFHMTAPEPV